MSTPIEFAFDFNKASNLSQNVGTATYVPHALATFTTNAAQWEPGEFPNGVSPFGPNNNVFIVHNAGANLGTNQRYAYLALATLVPISFTQFTVNVGTNASSHPPTNPVFFAIEASPSDDFAGAVNIGTVSSAVMSDQTVNMNFEISSGLTYIRIRVTSAIPDGSNYVAYQHVKFVGSAILGGPIDLLYDFNTAAQLARVVATSVPHPNITSVFTSNALQWEPGEFSNGVASFGQNDNVFILHNAGSNLATNQRYAYIGLATTVPLVITQLSVNIGSNASGNSPSNPVTIAVETAEQDYFFPTYLLGTISSVNHTLPLHLHVPPGTTYIRLRSTSSIPDGSNYIAYDHCELVGSVDTPAPITPPAPQSGQGKGTSNTFELLYDFNTAVENALNVASAKYVAHITSVFTTNASQWEPGEFSNGVGVFGPNDNVFIVHNSGSAQGVNQRYAFLALATAVPLVLSGLSANIGSNASGNSPTNPVIIAIEASFSDDFANSSELGTISTANSALAMAVLIPSGVTYIRLRALSPIPDGSNYIAYDHVKLSGSVAQVGL